MDQTLLWLYTLFHLLPYREQKWLEEKKQVLLAASDHIERLRLEREKLSEHKWVQWPCHGKLGEKFRERRQLGEYGVWFTVLPSLTSSIILDTKAKIQKIKVYQEKLLETLGDVLETHIPLPKKESSASKRKKVQNPCVVSIPAFVSYNHFYQSRFSFQSITHEITEDLISLSEILEVGTCTTKTTQMSHCCYKQPLKG